MQIEPVRGQQFYDNVIQIEKYFSIHQKTVKLLRTCINYRSLASAAFFLFVVAPLSMIFFVLRTEHIHSTGREVGYHQGGDEKVCG